jgi:hypothetical protein
VRCGGGGGSARTVVECPIEDALVDEEGLTYLLHLGMLRVLEILPHPRLMAAQPCWGGRRVRPGAHFRDVHPHELRRMTAAQTEGRIRDVSRERHRASRAERQRAKVPRSIAGRPPLGARLASYYMDGELMRTDGHLPVVLEERPPARRGARDMEQRRVSQPSQQPHPPHPNAWRSSPLHSGPSSRRRASSRQAGRGGVCVRWLCAHGVVRLEEVAVARLALLPARRVQRPP